MISIKMLTPLTLSVISMMEIFANFLRLALSVHIREGLPYRESNKEGSN